MKQDLGRLGFFQQPPISHFDRTYEIVAGEKVNVRYIEERFM